MDNSDGSWKHGECLETWLLIPKRCTLLKRKILPKHHYHCQGKWHWFFFLLWIEAWIFILALHEVAGEEDLNSDSIGEYAVCSHSWCKCPRLLCRSLNFQERTVFKCCITYLFNEAAYFSFLHSLFQMNYVLDEAVCVDCRGTGQARSCTSDAVKLLSFPSSVLYEIRIIP